MSRTQEGDGENPFVYLWYPAVQRSINSKRGQGILKEIVSALDAMPVKELHAQTFTKGGEMCVLGALAESRGLSMAEFELKPPNEYGYQEPVNTRDVAAALEMPRLLTWDIMHENDKEGPFDETPGGRWTRMRRWIASKIHGEVPNGRHR